MPFASSLVNSSVRASSDSSAVGSLPLPGVDTGGMSTRVLVRGLPVVVGTASFCCDVEAENFPRTSEHKQNNSEPSAVYGLKGRFQTIELVEIIVCIHSGGWPVRLNRFLVR
jgi:hypothetical protein